MHSTIIAAAAGLAALIPAASAQTYSECNPTNASQFPCPENAGLNTESWNSDFAVGKNTSWSYVAPAVRYGSDGAEFTVTKRDEAPTIKTDFYIFYGKVEVKMKSAPGQGIVSSIVLQSEDLDEIDWEFLGGNNGIVQTNYFGKGNTTTYDRMQQFDVATPQDTVHTYSIDWTEQSIVWAIDGTAVRTLNYADANGGSNFPQTPMNIRLGIWAGGDPANDYWTIQWAGGETTYDTAAGMPWTMYVEDVTVTNYNPGCSYNYTDTTGSSGSISVSKDGCDLFGTSPTQTSSGETTVSTLAAGAAADSDSGSATGASETAAAVGSTTAAGNDPSVTATTADIGSNSASGTGLNGAVGSSTVGSATTPEETAPTGPIAASLTSAGGDDDGATSTASVSTIAPITATDELGSGTLTLVPPTGATYPISSESTIGDVTSVTTVSTMTTPNPVLTPTSTVFTTPASTPSATPSEPSNGAASIAVGGLGNALFLAGVAAALAL